MTFVTQIFHPYSYEEDGKAAGPVVDIIHKICTELHIDYTIEVHPWTRCQKMVANGDANALFVLAKNSDRKTSFYFSPSIFQIEYGFFVHETNKIEYDNLDQISSYDIGVFGPSNTSNVLEKLKSESNEFTINIRPSSESGFKKLESKRIDAVFSNRDVGKCIISKHGIDSIRYAGAYKESNYYIAFSKAFSDRIMVDSFNEKYLSLNTKGEISTILKQYSFKNCICEH